MFYKFSFTVFIFSFGCLHSNAIYNIDDSDSVDIELVTFDEDFNIDSEYESLSDFFDNLIKKANLISGNNSPSIKCIFFKDLNDIRNVINLIKIEKSKQNKDNNDLQKLVDDFKSKMKKLKSTYKLLTSKKEKKSKILISGSSNSQEAIFDGVLTNSKRMALYSDVNNRGKEFYDNRIEDNNDNHESLVVCYKITDDNDGLSKTSFQDSGINRITTTSRDRCTDILHKGGN